MLGDLTDRAATGIAHAVRYTREHETALEMQRAFLNTPTVTGPGVETLGRYLPAGSGAEVGGDWFDTLALPTTARCWWWGTSWATESARRRR